MSKYSDNMPPDLKDAIGWMYDYIEPNKVFMDFGCSTGYFGSLIKEAKTNKVYGVEISPDIREARKVLDGVYSFDLDGDWPEEVYERKYDYLFFGDVIEHLKDPGLALKKCKKLLKPNGLIFISTPNIAHVSIRLQLMGGNFDYEPMGILDNTHLKYFTRKSLKALVEEAGYYPKVMDFSANDYPDESISHILNKLGLKPQAAFWALINKPEARAFQHKFIIAPRTRSNEAAVPKRPSDYQKPETIRNAELDDLKDKVKNLEDHAKKQAAIIEHYVIENKQLEETLAASVLHKVSRKAKRVARKISRRIQ